MRTFCTRAHRALAFGVSALLSIRLFVSLAGDPAAAALLGGLALCLEYGKLQAIRGAKERRSLGSTVLAATLVGLSLVASAGSALALIEEQAARAQALEAAASREDERLALATQSIRHLDKELSVLTRKLDETPTLWAGTVKALRSELDDLRQLRRREAQALSAYEPPRNAQPGAQARLFRLLAEAIGLPYQRLLLGFLIVAAAALEGILVMNDAPRTVAQPSEEQSPRRASAQTAYDVPLRRRLGRTLRTPKADDRLAEFLENLLADTPPGAYTRVSRDTAAKSLGITSWQAKALYGEAVALGLIEPRGKRTWRVAG